MIMAVVFVIGMYFIWAPQDAKDRFNLSIKHQSMFLIGMFAMCAIDNILKLLAAISLGTVGPGIIAVLFLALDIFLINLYRKRL